MLDDDHRDFPAQAVEGLEQFLDDRGSKALERLVEPAHPDVPRQRARHRDHLLLATGEEIRRRVESRGELREEMQDLVVGPGYAVALASLEASQLEFVPHAQAGNQAPALRNVADAAARDFRRRAAGEICAAERD